MGARGASEGGWAWGTATAVGYGLAAVEAGAGAGLLTALGGWGLGTALGVACAASIPLVPLQAWLLTRAARARPRRRSATPAREAALGLGATLGFVVSTPLVPVAAALGVGLLLAAGWAWELAGAPTTDLVAALQARATSLGGPHQLPIWVRLCGVGLLAGGFAALAVVWALALGWLRGLGAGSAFREVLAVVPARRLHVGAATAASVGLGGALAWLGGPVWLSALPGLDAADATLPGVVALVVLVAPLAEELVFRGFLWGALCRWAPRGLVLAATTAAFAALHIGPVAVLPAIAGGSVLGGLRLASGSLLPPLLVHAVANALALAATLGDVPGAALVAAAAITCAAAVAWAPAGPPGYRTGV